MSEVDIPAPYAVVTPVCLPPGTGRNRRVMANIAFFAILFITIFVLFAAVFVPTAAESLATASPIIIAVLGALSAPIGYYYVGKNKMNAEGIE